MRQVRNSIFVAGLLTAGIAACSACSVLAQKFVRCLIAEIKLNKDIK